MQRIIGKTITRWRRTELPKIQNLRIDLLGETSDGELTQIEGSSSSLVQLCQLVTLMAKYGEAMDQ